MFQSPYSKIQLDLNTILQLTARYLYGFYDSLHLTLKYCHFQCFGVHVWHVCLQTCKPLLVLPFPSPLWLFSGAPGDTVLLSSLTDWHEQNESSSLLPKTRLCPRGALAGCISIAPAVLECTDCDGPWAPLAPHRLSRIMQPCLHRQAWSMSWTAQAYSCRREASMWCEWFPVHTCTHLIPPPSSPVIPVRVD